MIEVLVETTPDLLPHTYYVNKMSGKLMAFLSVDDKYTVYEKPLSFSKRYRTFKKIDEMSKLF